VSHVLALACAAATRGSVDGIRFTVCTTARWVMARVVRSWKVRMLPGLTFGIVSTVPYGWSSSTFRSSRSLCIVQHANPSLKQVSNFRPKNNSKSSSDFAYSGQLHANKPSYRPVCDRRLFHLLPSKRRCHGCQKRAPRSGDYADWRPPEHSIKGWGGCIEIIVAKARHQPGIGNHQRSGGGAAGCGD
jgi:hypothetical protein